MELAFAGLHQLCAPMLDRLEHLPGPQRDALGTAFGLSAGEAADRFLVGLAVLSLLSDVAEGQPLVCLVDDAQWLDRVSAQTLCVRGPPTPGGIGGPGVRRPRTERRRRVGGLAGADDRRAEQRVMPARCWSRRSPGGSTNGCVIGSSPRHAATHWRCWSYPAGSPRPSWPAASRFLTLGRWRASIEHSFLRRVAVAPGADPTTAARGGGRAGRATRPCCGAPPNNSGSDAEAAAPAEADGLIEFGARVRFRHPLVRSAAYRSGSPADRQDVHHALADATDPQSDPDRRAWHRAHAAAGTRRGRRRRPGTVSRTGEEPRWRRRRSRVPGAGGRADRATRPDARRGLWRRPKPSSMPPTLDVAEALLAAAEIGPLDDLQRARVARLRAEIVFARRRGSDDAPLLLDAARRLEGLDDRLARETYLEALGAAIFAGRLSTHPTLREVAEAARMAPAAPSPPRPIDCCWTASRRGSPTDTERRLRPLRRGAAAVPPPRRGQRRRHHRGGSGWHGSSPASCGTTR